MVVADLRRSAALTGTLDHRSTTQYGRQVSSAGEGRDGSSREPAGWVIRGAVKSEVGKRRRNNEDAFGFFPELSLYIVADGMGGHAAGQVASALAVESIRRSMLETAEEDLTAATDNLGHHSVGGRRLVIALQNANECVLETSRGDPKMRGMGTTVAAVLFDAPCRAVAVCHAGDTRVYRVRGDAIEQLTEDHTVSAQLVREGQLRPEDVPSSKHRHVLTQAVGTNDVLHPELRLEEPCPGDVFVVCSDGVHDVVTAEEILACLAQVRQDLDAACERLIRLANERGGKDNSTVLIVSCEAGGASA